MKNEEITLVIILLIVVIIAVLILSLTPAETNPKNLTVDSAQLTQSTQKAKPGDPVIRFDKLNNIKGANRCGLIALLTILLIVIIGVVSQLSGTGKSAQKNQVGIANQLSESQNAGDKALAPSEMLNFVAFENYETILVVYAFMFAIVYKNCSILCSKLGCLGARRPVVAPINQLVMTLMISGTITYGIVVGTGYLLAVPDIIGAIIVVAMTIGVLGVITSLGRRFSDMSVLVSHGVITALGFILGCLICDLDPSVMQ